ncbi:Peptidase family M23 [Thiothrix caldifontis]|uniref:Peptidase family M23 n=1 Tax=Thiothrix caldifontis TaxID=525918 RepID=A0A1H3Y1D4_9GAMM|nr:M23 family metallopeptidase [Thiothrix caldifontis]SEA05545.1 Peptidase family M23 [Thiothrix caldifontis]
MKTTCRSLYTWLEFSAVLGFLGIVAIFLLPEIPQIPVQGASAKDWNPKSFWYYPWGRSGTHKGIDIFAKEGTPVQASTAGLVVRSGVDSLGGNVVAVLGAKWRIHYYAHLQTIKVNNGQWVTVGANIGTVGTSGNAQGKPPHLHYDIRTLYPQPWLYDSSRQQAWRRMFFVDPNSFLGF